MGGRVKPMSDKELKGLKCENGKKLKRVSVGGADNLYIYVYPSEPGIKLTKVFYFGCGDTQKKIGEYPFITLAEARAQAVLMKRDTHTYTQSHTHITFEKATELYLEHKRKILSENTIKKELSRLKYLTYLNKKNIRDITKGDISRPLKAINDSKGIGDNLIRTKNLASQILDYMIELDYLEVKCG